MEWHCDNCERDFEGKESAHVCPYCGLGDIEPISPLKEGEQE